MEQQGHNSPVIIQLDEVSAPAIFKGQTPFHRSNPATTPSSSYASSSYWSSSEDDDESDDDCESYCSSDDESDTSTAEDPSMSRVLAWRSSFDSVYGDDAEVFKTLKRKYGHTEDLTCESDSSSGSSQRRRVSISSTLHICSACDASFPTLHHLQHHANGSDEAEACRVAVQYGFES